MNHEQDILRRAQQAERFAIALLGAALALQWAKIS